MFRHTALKKKNVLPFKLLKTKNASSVPFSRYVLVPKKNGYSKLFIKFYFLIFYLLIFFCLFCFFRMFQLHCYYFTVFKCISIQSLIIIIIKMISWWQHSDFVNILWLAQSDHMKALVHKRYFNIAIKRYSHNLTIFSHQFQWTTKIGF